MWQEWGAGHNTSPDAASQKTSAPADRLEQSPVEQRVHGHDLDRAGIAPAQQVRI